MNWLLTDNRCDYQTEYWLIKYQIHYQTDYLFSYHLLITNLVPDLSKQLPATYSITKLNTNQSITDELNTNLTAN